MWYVYLLELMTEAVMPCVQSHPQLITAKCQIPLECVFFICTRKVFVSLHVCTTVQKFWVSNKCMLSFKDAINYGSLFWPHNLNKRIKINKCKIIISYVFFSA